MNVTPTSNPTRAARSLDSRKPAPSPSASKKAGRPSDPETLLDEVRSLLREDFAAARQLAIDAATRRILAGGTARVGTGGPQPSHHADYEWLRCPPEALRGHWVALVDGHLVGSGETLEALEESLAGQALERTPLVHRIA